MNTVLTYSRIEPGDLEVLLDEIHSILSEVGAHNLEIYNDRYWDWQYNELPTGISLVYGAWDAKRLIGYFHVPVYRCLIDGHEMLIGNVQDVAVNPDFRRMGVFRGLSEFANLDIDKTEVDLLYSFPNEQSIRTFRLYNKFSPICKLPSYLRPIDAVKIFQQKFRLFGIGRILGFTVDLVLNSVSRSVSLEDEEDCSIERFTEVNESIECVFQEYSKSFSNHIIRDSAWLEWRYMRSARGRHQILGLRESGQLTAVVILKEERVMGNPSCVVMDFAYTNGKTNSLLYLLQNICRNPKVVGFNYNLVYISGLSPVLSNLRRLGFVRIPKFANPRVLNLVTRSSNKMPEEGLAQKDNWLVTLGDWDVF